MSISVRQILFNHLKELLHIQRILNGLLQICKSHYLWDLRPPILVSQAKKTTHGEKG